MGAIEVKTTNRIITVIVDGALTREDAVAIVAEHYPKLKDTGCVWDLRRSDVFQLSQLDLESIALAVAHAADGHATPKSAFLVADSRAYAKVCAYLSQQARMRARVEAAVFTDADEAFRWVQQA